MLHMILAVDVGNTNILLGGIDGSKIHFQTRVSTGLGKTGGRIRRAVQNIPRYTVYTEPMWKAP